MVLGSLGSVPDLKSRLQKKPRFSAPPTCEPLRMFQGTRNLLTTSWRIVTLFDVRVTVLHSDFALLEKFKSMSYFLSPSHVF
jgi:hypothetical protein